MANERTISARDTAIGARTKAGAPAFATVSGQIALEDKETGPHRVQIFGPGAVLSTDCHEIAENTRAIRRGKAPPRRLLRLDPLSVNLADGPVLVVLHSGDAPARVLAHLDLPGADITRFRHLLQLELQHGITANGQSRRAARLERGFAALPGSPDNPDWVESWILLNTLRRARPSRTHGLIGRLRHLRSAEGRPEMFTAFLAALTDTHGLQLPNGHGYGASLEQHDRTALWQGISDIMAMLKGLKLKVFLNSGTLLGAVREGDLLGHDDDIDLAVLIPGQTQEEAAQAWLDLRQRLNDMGVLTASAHRNRFSVLKLPRINGVQVDLFPAWFDAADALHIYPYATGELTRADLLPLKPGPHPGTRIPARAERLLEQNYGASWRVPDPHFRFPWEESGLKFRPFMSVLRAAQEAEATQ